jgi:hypothetical protein
MKQGKAKNNTRGRDYEIQLFTAREREKQSTVRTFLQERWQQLL